MPLRLQSGLVITEVTVTDLSARLGDYSRVSKRVLLSHRAPEVSREHLRGQRGERYLDEVLPLLLAGADGFLNAAQLAADGLSFVQLVVGVATGHLPVDPAAQTWAF